MSPWKTHLHCRHKVLSIAALLYLWNIPVDMREKTSLYDRDSIHLGQRAILFLAALYFDFFVL